MKPHSSFFWQELARPAPSLARPAKTIARPRIGLLASVGITIDSFFPEIVIYLRGLGYSVSTAAGTPTSQIDSTIIPGMTRKPSLTNWRARTALKGWIRDNNLSVIVTNTATASALARFFVRDCPVLYFCHGLHWDENSSFRALPWKLIEIAAIRRTAGVITLNREDEQWFNVHAPHLKVTRLPFGVGIDPATYTRTPRRRSSELKLCWIGEFTARKNPADALKVAAALRRMGTPFHLDMLGDGTQYESIKTMLGSLGLERHVSLRGHTAASRYLTDSDALIHTARWEGLPRVFLEALAVGRPIFSYDIKGARDIPCVNLTPYGDPDVMASNISNHDWDAARALNEYPSPGALSFTAAAKQLVGFVEEVLNS